jgi:hypothetical protein
VCHRTGGVHHINPASYNSIRPDAPYHTLYGWLEPILYKEGHVATNNLH